MLVKIYCVQFLANQSHQLVPTREGRSFVRVYMMDEFVFHYLVVSFIFTDNVRCVIRSKLIASLYLPNLKG